MFGDRNRESHTENNENIGTIDIGMAGYFGGLESIPDPKGINVYLHDDRIEISFLKSNSTLDIPYRNITSVENIDKTEFLYSVLRGRTFPIPDILTYTKIQYKENSVDHYVVIDFAESFGFVMGFLEKKLK